MVCGDHPGDLFDDGRPSKGSRHGVNSLSLRFEPQQQEGCESAREESDSVQEGASQGALKLQIRTS